MGSYRHNLSQSLLFFSQVDVATRIQIIEIKSISDAYSCLSVETYSCIKYLYSI